MEIASTTTPSLNPSVKKWTIASVGAAVVSAVFASLCCLGPLVFAVLGIGGAGLLVKFEPYRPYFALLTLLLLAAGFYFTYAPARAPKVAAGADCACEHPKSNKLGKVMLWMATVLVIGFLVFPYIAAQLFG